MLHDVGRRGRSVCRPDYQDYPQEVPDYSSWQGGMSYSSNELPPGSVMAARIPPSLDGRMS
eukprot:10822483-Prorocentrum_lima.AAC.1